MNDGDVLAGTDWYWADKTVHGGTGIRSVRAAQRFANFEDAEKNVRHYFGLLRQKNVWGNPIVYAVVIQRNFYSPERAMPTGNRREFWLNTETKQFAQKESVKAPDLMRATN